MSVELILSHRGVVLDPYNRATLNIKATFSSQPSGIFALYKVRTNAKDMVDVRPSFGLLHCQDEDNTIASMQIKYLGNMEVIPKMKLQVSWVWGEGIPQKKLNHSQFSQLYASLKEKIGKEKHHMLQFSSPHSTQNSQESINLAQPGTEKEPREAETVFEGDRDHQQEAQTSQKDGNIVPGEIKSRKVGWIWIIIGVLTAFLVGLLMGMKLQSEMNFLKSIENPYDEVEEEPEPSKVAVESQLPQQISQTQGSDINEEIMKQSEQEVLGESQEAL